MLGWSVMDRSNLQNLRRVLASRRGRRGRMPAILRQRALEHARRRHEAGATTATIAAELGLSRVTIRRWTTSPAPVPVQVVDGTGAPEKRPSTLSVISPSGFRVEGLSLEEATTLLRVLG